MTVNCRLCAESTSNSWLGGEALAGGVSVGSELAVAVGAVPEALGFPVGYVPLGKVLLKLGVGVVLSFEEKSPLFPSAR